MRQPMPTLAILWLLPCRQYLASRVSGISKCLQTSSKFSRGAITALLVTRTHTCTHGAGYGGTRGTASSHSIQQRREVISPLLCCLLNRRSFIVKPCAFVRLHACMGTGSTCSPLCVHGCFNRFLVLWHERPVRFFISQKLWEVSVVFCRMPVWVSIDDTQALIRVYVFVRVYAKYVHVCMYICTFMYICMNNCVYKHIRSKCAHATFIHSHICLNIAHMWEYLHNV
jgi:hypothetical protein